MPGGTSPTLTDLPVDALRILQDARRAVLATIAADGSPRIVPVGFALREGEVVTAIDRKPKSGRRLARLRNLERDARVSLLADRWDEDWTGLGWVRVEGTARIEAPGSAAAELRARYPQYREEPPDGEVIVVTP
ncbi:MAG: TIGR03668 family PPOX class F420-dependent oxidoreductase, partial [Actinomycetota bacterium]